MAANIDNNIIGGDFKHDITTDCDGNVIMVGQF